MRRVSLYPMRLAPLFAALSMLAVLVTSTPARSGVTWSVEASATGAYCDPTFLQVGNTLLLEITARTDDRALAISGSVNGYDDSILQFDPTNSILPDTIFNDSCDSPLGCVGGLLNQVGLTVPFEEANVGPGVEVAIVSASSGLPAAGFGEADPGAFTGVAGDPQFRIAFTVIGAGATTIGIGSFPAYLDGYTGTLDSLATNTSLTVTTAVFAYSDADADRVPDECDNCSILPNGRNSLPGQLDTDADGYGNACDADYNQDLLTTTLDFGTFLTAFTGAAPNPDTDHNGDGETTTLDFPLYLKAFTGVVSPVGPSGYPCAGISVPCPDDLPEE